jgi:hypothetical protein
MGGTYLAISILRKLSERVFPAKVCLRIDENPPSYVYEVVLEGRDGRVRALDYTVSEREAEASLIPADAFVETIARRFIGYL